MYEDEQTTRQTRPPDGAQGTTGVVVAPSRTRDPAPKDDTPDHPDFDTPEGQLYMRLWLATGWQAVAGALVTGLGMSRRELARGAGVTPPTVTKWLEATEADDVRAYEGLNRVRTVVLKLLDAGFQINELQFWLTTVDPVLNKNSDGEDLDVLTAIADGRVGDAVQAGLALATARAIC